MTLPHPRRVRGKRLPKTTRPRSRPGARLAALLLCLAVLAGALPVLASAEGEAPRMLAGFVTISDITLQNAAEEAVPDNALLQRGEALTLHYEYAITAEQCLAIADNAANTPYYLAISPHLKPPENLSEPLKTDDGTRFGTLCADGGRAWVKFVPDALQNFAGGFESTPNEPVLTGAYLDLRCTRADNVPENEHPIAGESNRYAMIVEERQLLKFGYAENEPLNAAAVLRKGGSGPADKTITWTISYTPWQNPSASDLEKYQVDQDTPFELRDTIDSSLHSLKENSVRIGGAPVADAAYYTSRGDIPEGAEIYVLAEPSEDGKSTLLTFGGTKLKAGTAKLGETVTPLTITYDTVIRDELLLPGGGDSKVTNTASLFGDGDKDGVFNSLSISSNPAEVTVRQPPWVTKTGTTDRHDTGGSTTAWTVTFQPNGFSFVEENDLTLHDQLPPGSKLHTDSVEVKVGGAAVPVAAGNLNVTPATDTAGQSFTVSGIITDNKPVTVTYRTSVGEDMYDSGTDLGSNTAQFKFRYKGKEYAPEIATPVDSGNGSGASGTATLLKSNGGYNAAARTIGWTVTINPLRADLQSGIFTDDLSQIGPACSVAGHTRGLEVADGRAGIKVLVGGTEHPDDNTVRVTYSDRKITVETNHVGRQTITLQYTTKVCDPCIFANNTEASLENTVSTTDMDIGSQQDLARSASSTAKASPTVLTKKAPVYDYEQGVMKWTVEVDAAGLPMTGVVLRDELPAGLTYVEDSLATDPRSGARPRPRLRPPPADGRR